MLVLVVVTGGVTTLPLCSKPEENLLSLAKIAKVGVRACVCVCVCVCSSKSQIMQLLKDSVYIIKNVFMGEVNACVRGMKCVYE